MNEVMKTIKTNGITYLEPLGSSQSWYWGEDYTSGDLYEAEELYNSGHPVKKNRLVLVHMPDGTLIEPVKLKDGQYFGRPSLYLDNKVYIVMVDFINQEIHLITFNPDEVLNGGSVHTLAILPLSHVSDCYNLMMSGISPILTRQSADQVFQIIWSRDEGNMNIEFQMEERESFSHRDGDKLYFTSWWEEEDPSYEYHDEVIIRNLQGEILDRFEGSILEIQGSYYLLK